MPWCTSGGIEAAPCLVGYVRRLPLATADDSDSACGEGAVFVRYGDCRQRRPIGHAH
jgi:hypothetical protein